MQSGLHTNPAIFERTHPALILLLIILVTQWASAEKQPTSQPPNVVLILADDLGYGP